MDLRGIQLRTLRHIQIKRIGIVLLLFITMHTEAQDSIAIQPSTLQLDPEAPEEKPKGIFKKALQAFKFRENRNRKEKERMYQFLKQKIDTNALKIDPTTILKISKQLEVLTQEIAESKAKEQSLEELIASLQKVEEAEEPEVDIDSLKAKIISVIQESIDANKKEKLDLALKISDFFNTSSGVDKTCSTPYFLSSDERKDSIIQGDTLKRYFKECLEPKIEVMGWYKAPLQNNFRNHQWNYLSIVNLYGYEVSATTGKTKKPKYVDEFINSGLITNAQDHGNKVFLTVYNSSQKEVTKFLRDDKVQQVFFWELGKVLDLGNLQGVNIYFKNLASKDEALFTAFMERLEQEMQHRKAPVQLAITMPPIINTASQKKTTAYNVEALNVITDHFIVLTDELINYKSNIAQSSAPLYQSNQKVSGTIASNVKYYTDVGLPTSKLIITVSYQGVEWKVEDFLYGTLKKGSKSKRKAFSDILKRYKEVSTGDGIVLEGFDKEQVMAYINITEEDKYNRIQKTQILYEDIRSLYQKYNWAADNGLGGVSIRGLTYDDGSQPYQDLWNILGTSLVEVDTVFVGEEVLFTKEFHAKLTAERYWDIFKKDLVIAFSPVLKYEDKRKGETKICMYSKHKQHIDSITSFTRIRKHRQKAWEIIPLYGSYEDEDEIIYLFQNKKQCVCLHSRWKIYSHLIGFLCIVFFSIFFILWYIVHEFDKKGITKEKLRTKIKWVQYGCIFFLVILIPLWVYLTPYIPSVGAGSTGSGFWVLASPIILGIIGGWFFKTIYNKGRFIRRGMP